MRSSQGLLLQAFFLGMLILWSRHELIDVNYIEWYGSLRKHRPDTHIVGSRIP